MSELNDLLEKNRVYSAGFSLGDLRPRAAKGLALLTCMDSRIEPLQALGLEPGDAKILRNAGGRATPDAIRSLAIAVAALGVRSIVVMHHTECAMSLMSNEQIRSVVTEAGGVAEEGLDFLAVQDAREGLLSDVEAIRHSPLMPPTEAVVGWSYDVRSGRISEIIGCS